MMSIRLTIGTALAAVMLLPAGAQAQSPPGHPISAGNPAPRIKVSSPQGRTYKVGTTIKFRFSCIAAKHSKTKTCKGTLLNRGHKPRAVKNGTKLCMTRAGTYMLKVSTRDNKHHFQYQTFAFRVK
jgi:hypothetical protein